MAKPITTDVQTARITFLVTLRALIPADSNFWQELKSCGGSPAKIRIWARDWNVRAAWLVNALAAGYRADADLPSFSWPALEGESRRVDRRRRAIATGRIAAMAVRFQVCRSEGARLAFLRRTARDLNLPTDEASVRLREDGFRARLRRVPLGVSLEDEARRIEGRSRPGRVRGRPSDAARKRVAREIRAFLALLEITPRRERTKQPEVVSLYTEER